MAKDEGGKRAGRGVQWLIGTIVIAASFLIGWLWMDYRAALDRPLVLDRPVYFEIAKGDGLARISTELERQGIIGNRIWFTLRACIDGSARQLKFGEYEIPPGTTLRQLLAMFVAGKVRQHPITLVEGWTFRQVLAMLDQSPPLTKLARGKSPEEIMRMVGAPDEHPEGRFYPDTYFVTKGTTDIEVLRRAYRKMQAVLEEEWANRDERTTYATPYESLIVASIVEKETARPEERPLIAGVVTRRLAKGMLLQTDPTIIYGLGDDFSGNIRKEDLLKDTPYNTYVRVGLPPTPIAMPGRDSIHAALHPAAGESLYFVARGDGTHVFTNTLEDHQRAVEQFQKRRHD
ncbi:endolytic transglycosylase MltG [Methylocaldum szegediense]|uniref:Endolytic murein transglycosylase n=1 Tax=Methylocaldum szegediense TaxID=73780 RepID=A0ABM9I661_9GAMM|nr:endolytic transglycosylase MltG [Methylocaldum szegediense]CAI8916974.1 Endolytic murein transglycosylase [Methylocaldum szegediense]